MHSLQKYFGFVVEFWIKNKHNYQFYFDKIWRRPIKIVRPEHFPFDFVVQNAESPLPSATSSELIKHNQNLSQHVMLLKQEKEKLEAKLASLQTNRVKGEDRQVREFNLLLVIQPVLFNNFTIWVLILRYILCCSIVFILINLLSTNKICSNFKY